MLHAPPHERAVILGKQGLLVGVGVRLRLLAQRLRLAHSLLRVSLCVAPVPATAAQAAWGISITTHAAAVL